MDAKGYPLNPAPHSTPFPEHPRPHDRLDRSFNSHGLDTFYTNQHMRPGLSRGHGSYSAASNQAPSAQLYPAHLQSLSTGRFSTPPNAPGAVNSSSIQVNRVATLPTYLPPTLQTHGAPRPQSPQTPPPPFQYMNPPSEFAPMPAPTNPYPLSEHSGMHQKLSPARNSLQLQEQTSSESIGVSDPSLPAPKPPTDEDDLALAIELSQKMVLKEQEREEQLRKQEEDEFEQALAQSMLETNRYGSYVEEDRPSSSSQRTLDSPRTYSLRQNPPAPASSRPHGSPSKPYPEAMSPAESQPPGLNATRPKDLFSRVVAGKQPIPPNAHHENASMLDSGSTERRLNQPLPSAEISPRLLLFQEEPEKVIRSRRSTLRNFASNPDTMRSPSPLQILSTVDEGGGLDEGMLTVEISTSPKAGSNVLSPSWDRSESPSELAYYAETEQTTPLATPPVPPEYWEARPKAAVSPKDAIPKPNPHSSHPPFVPPFPKSEANHPYHPSPETTDPMQETGSLHLERASSQGSAHNKYPALPTPGVPALPAGAAPAAPQVIAANQYIDPDLLMGVSIDFKEPLLSARLFPMPGAVPNIVSLPYGRCLPLHVQAPSWRHLLKLLARMGNTKFEPTDMAKAALRNAEIKLRTVVQFVKVNPMDDQWRTVLWFTIDHPVPPSLPHAGRYTIPNPNQLPFSYELINLPQILRNANDSAMSKTYTIQASESLPYPTIPMSFPNLALYLQAALDFSRKQKDDSSGYRRLAKMLQTCYPHTDEPSDEPAERKTVGGLFKRVIGIGNNKKKSGKTNNEETYEYITPFVPDEWG